MFLRKIRKRFGGEVCEYWSLCEPVRGEIAWSEVAAFLTAGTFCGQASELGVVGNWYARTALEDHCGIPAESVNDGRLRRALDKPGAHKGSALRASHGALPGLVRRHLRVPALRCD